MRPPHFTIQDIKYAEDSQTFQRAQDMFRSGKIGTIREDIRGYSARIQGTKTYDVSVSYKRIDVGSCSCYLGQNDTLCKHMLALALAVLDKSGGLQTNEPITNLNEVQECVNEGIRKLVPYNGPSRVWFEYQRKLAIGSGIIIDAIESLPASKKNADYLWKLVLRISKKLATGGIDDSEGEVGTCVYAIIEKLGAYSKESPELIPTLLSYSKDDTGFGFEDELRALIISKG